MQEAPAGTPNTPVATTKKPRFFYGWVIVLVSAIANMTAFGAGQGSFSVFLQPMSAALGWSRTTMTGAATLQSLGNIVVSPIVGPIIDKHGPRMVMVVGATVASVAFLLMGQITEPWQFYVLFTVATALGLQEVGPFITNATVSKWFVRMRGRAIAFTLLGNDVGTILIVPLTAFVIEAAGWGTAWAVLGVMVVVVVIPPTLAFMRRAPEDMGLLPDGDSTPSNPEDRLAAQQRRANEPKWTVREALHNRTAWLLIIAGNLTGMGIGATITHQVAYFTDIGLTLQAASFVFAINRVAAIVGKLVYGFTAEHVPVRYCLMSTQLGGAIGLLILLLGTTTDRVYVFAVISGLLRNAWGPLSNQIWADYYGRANIGAIRGATAPFNVAASLGGTLFAAVMYDWLGSYTAAFWIFTVTLLMGCVIMFFATPPGREPSSRAVEASL